MKKSRKTDEIDIEATGTWPQTWANYYSHLTQSMNMKETNAAMEKERAIRRVEIKRAKEHLDGVDLFYVQSYLKDPNPPGEKEKDTSVPSNNNGKTVHTKELSDKEI